MADFNAIAAVLTKELHTAQHALRAAEKTALGGGYPYPTGEAFLRKARERVELVKKALGELDVLTCCLPAAGAAARGDAPARKAVAAAVAQAQKRRRA